MTAEAKRKGNRLRCPADASLFLCDLRIIRVCFSLRVFCSGAAFFPPCACRGFFTVTASFSFRVFRVVTAFFPLCACRGFFTVTASFSFRVFRIGAAFFPLCVCRGFRASPDCIVFFFSTVFLIDCAMIPIPVGVFSVIPERNDRSDLSGVRSCTMFFMICLRFRRFQVRPESGRQKAVFLQNISIFLIDYFV